jgi:pyruvate carboxylase subunit B
MPGKLVRVLVSAGQDVGAGQGLVVMEAMKMENEIRAHVAGVVREIAVAVGDSVRSGGPLLRVAEA